MTQEQAILDTQKRVKFIYIVVLIIVILNVLPLILQALSKMSKGA